DPPPPADKTPPAFVATLQAAVPGGVAALSYWVGDWTIISPAAQILDVARHLRDAPDAAFDLLSDLTAVDWPPRRDGRFDVVYCLYSTRHRHRVRVKVKVGERVLDGHGWEGVGSSVVEARAGGGRDSEGTSREGGRVIVADDGRGVPAGGHSTGEYRLGVAQAVLHDGGKFGGGSYKVSGG